MKSKAPQLHLEYRFYKLLGSHGKFYMFISIVVVEPISFFPQLESVKLLRLHIKKKKKSK